jgi:hypothetical protein
MICVSWPEAVTHALPGGEIVNAITVSGRAAGRNGSLNVAMTWVKTMQAYPEPSAIEYEHVCLYAVEPDEPLPSFMPSAVSAKLDQSTPRFERRLVIFDGSYLGVHSASRATPPHKYWLRMAFLDPRPVSPASPAWWRISCALALGGAVMLTAGMAGIEPARTWTAGGLALCAAGIASAVFAWRRARDRLVFYTRHGRAPVAQLLRNRPDRRSAGEFLAMLQRAIECAAAERDGPRAQFLRDEMREHRRLLDEGVLPREEYEAAQARILGAHG